ncbi:unnamed protein product [Danaus chrysippus]|uniref:(African queen) hypothetical protein n=1 Tax=Danaus chrysippus TaxID=151541 RepID=A0A8J2QBY0_9NEOP|nr:unnamed protein product [Danaus chrysippus]
MFLFNSCKLLNSTVRRIVQGPKYFNGPIMGSSCSRSFSPNSGQPKNRNGAVTSVEPNSEYVEEVVCKVNDINENEMKVFDIGEDGKVLVVKQKGEINALGPKCTHYGAPLSQGALGDGRIRCHWHGACFNLKTGDIEDFPGFDSLPCYQVTITKKGEVKVRAKKSDLKTNKRTKELVEVTELEDTSVVIVGGGPSGGTCAETLRNEGFKGKITLICKEKYLPYDRVKVSKVSQIPEVSKLEARTSDYYSKAKIDVIRDNEVTNVNTEEKYVECKDGKKVSYNYLYLASGTKPRVPDIPGVGMKNIFTVRDYDDSVNIFTALGDQKDKNVVVLGFGFIGLEIASTCVAKAKSMTVVGKDTAPLANVFGTSVGQNLQKLFEDNGINFVFETTIVKCDGENGYIKSVELANGSVLPADMLILGVGTTYYTDYLKGSGVNMRPDGSIEVNEMLETNVKNVYAGGDIAYAPVFALNNAKSTIGHIGLAQYHGLNVAKTIAGKGSPIRAVPFFWTMLFGKSIRYAGSGRAASSQIVGDVSELKFVIFFFDEAEKVIAVASCMRDPVVSQFAELLSQGKSVHKKDLVEDPFVWTKWIN